MKSSQPRPRRRHSPSSSSSRPLRRLRMGAALLVFAALWVDSVSSNALKPEYKGLILTKSDFFPHGRQSKSNVADEPNAALPVPLPFVVRTELNVKDGALHEGNNGGRSGRTYTDQEGATVIEGKLKIFLYGR